MCYNMNAVSMVYMPLSLYVVNIYDFWVVIGLFLSINLVIIPNDNGVTLIVTAIFDFSID